MKIALVVVTAVDSKNCSVAARLAVPHTHKLAAFQNEAQSNLDSPMGRDAFLSNYFYL